MQRKNLHGDFSSAAAKMVVGAPKYINPSSMSTTVLNTRPHSGTLRRGLMRDHSWLPGMAPSRAKAYVQREAAVRAPVRFKKFAVSPVSCAEELIASNAGDAIHLYQRRTEFRG